MKLGLRLLGLIGVVGMPGGGSAGAQTLEPRPTAVFTLDAHSRTFSFELGESPNPRIRSWVESCRVTPGGAIYLLTCPQGAREDSRARPGASIPSPSNQVASNQVDVTAALFRDLDETLYVAACPIVEETSVTPRGGRAGRGRQRGDQGFPAPRAARADPADERLCRSIRPGQTFSTEVGAEALWIVARGRRLPFRLYRVTEKKTSIETPYEPEPSRRLPSARPLSGTPPPPAIETAAAPNWSPPPLGRLSRGKPSSRAVSENAPAKTSLRTGTVMISCAAAQAWVVVDGADVGACPVNLPLVAGEHVVRVRRIGRDDWVREFSLSAGQTLRLRSEP